MRIVQKQNKKQKQKQKQKQNKIQKQENKNQTKQNKTKQKTQTKQKQKQITKTKQNVEVANFKFTESQLLHFHILSHHEILEKNPRFDLDHSLKDYRWSYYIMVYFFFIVHTDHKYSTIIHITMKVRKGLQIGSQMDLNNGLRTMIIYTRGFNQSWVNN